MRRSGAVLAAVLVGCYDLAALQVDKDRPLEERPDGAAAIDAGGVETGVDGAAAFCGATGAVTGLVGFYPLDETNGTSVPDCSGNGLDGIIVTGTQEWRRGHLAGGLRSSATSGCTELGKPPSFDFTGAFSVAVWVQVDALPTQAALAGYIIGKTEDVDIKGWRLASGQAGISLAIARPSQTRLDVHCAVTAPSAWIHVAGVAIPGGTMTLYLGGVQCAQAPGAPSPLLADGAAKARIGCRSDGTQTFEGTIDDLRIFNRALGPEEILTLANQ